MADVKEMDINELNMLDNETLDKIETDKRILCGFKKDFKDIIVLSIGHNETRNVPYIDVRTFTKDRHTDKYIPLKAGLRLDPAAYSLLLTMMKLHENLVTGEVYNDARITNQGPTASSNHLDRQLLDNEQY